MKYEDINKEIKVHTKLIFQEIVSIRRWLHKHPELSFKEKKTSEYICRVLEKHNISFTTGVGGYGVVALIKCQDSKSKVIGVRADMDALPIQEKNNIEYKSINDGVMHACGHDVHTSIALGTAIVLNHLKHKLIGTVKIIFQPAEEQLPGGASLMIEQGVLEKPRVDKMLALHVFPEFEVGDIGFRSGQYMAACDELSVTVKGKGGHAALPQKVINPINAAANLLINIKREVSNIAKGKKYVLEFGDFHAYGASNVIPENAFLQGTLRTLDESFRKEVYELLLFESKKIEKNYNVSCAFNIKKGYPSLYNNPDLTEYCVAQSKNFLDKNFIKELDVRMASEDFAYFSQNCPSCFFRLGVANSEKKITNLVHTPYFNVDEKCLEIGVGLMSYLTAVNLLSLKAA